MELWLAGILLILCMTGIVGMTLYMRKKNKKRLHTAGVILLALCSLALCGYLIVSGILLYAIQQ